MEITLDLLKSKLSNLDDAISYRRQKNYALQVEICELQKAYDKLGNIKKNNSNNANRIRKEVKRDQIAKDVAWKGESKKEFDDILNDDVKKAANEFYDSIDRMQDEVGKVIGKKKGEYDTGLGVLNSLNTVFNDISWQIRTWGN